MAQDEIKTRITVDADDAQRELDQTSRKEKELAGTTKEMGEAADGASRASGRMTGALSRKQRALASVGTAVKGMITSWLGFTALAVTIISVFRDIGAEARRTVAAIVEVGKSLRGLSANIGGEKAADVFREVTRVAAESRFNVQGRSDLLKGISAATDVRENLTRPQIQDLTENLALLQRTTGVGGAEGFRTIESLSANLGIPDEQAVDVAVTLINAGFGARAVQEITERGGNVGGLDVLALTLAARSQGLDPNRAGRALPTLIGALTRKDESGQLSQNLRDLGLTEDMSLVDRLRELVEQREAGAITEGQFFGAVGGEQQARLIVPLARVLSQPGMLEAARAALDDPQAAESQLAEILKNEFVRAQERANVRELRIAAKRERSALTAVGEELAHFEADTARVPGIVKALAFIGNLPNLAFPADPEAAAQGQIRQIDLLTKPTVPASPGARRPGLPIPAGGLEQLDIDDIHERARLGLNPIGDPLHPTTVIINDNRIISHGTNFNMNPDGMTVFTRPTERLE